MAASPQRDETRPGRPRAGAPAAALASGLTLLELMLTVALLAVIVMIASAQMADYQERARVQEAINDIATISALIRDFHLDNGMPPDSLLAVGRQGQRDPWGNPYHYTRLTGPGHGEARKDRRLNPLNSDFDLFSAGKDGVFKPQISHADSLDDVIRASDGRFIDLASKY